jgi:5-methylthioadenosine/S-adenosylhomocysteine deaminase
MRRARSRIASTVLLFFAAFAPGTASAAPAKLVITDALLFTLADGDRTPFRGHLVVAPDGSIAAVGPGEPEAGAWDAAETIDAGGRWVMPGFISAHSHLWQSAYRGLASDQTLMGWVDALYMERAMKAPPEAFYWFTLHGALDHLRHGITGAYNFNYGGWREGDFAREQFRAEAESGIRFVHGYNVGRMGGETTAASAGAQLSEFLAWVETRRSATPGLLSVMFNGAAAFTDGPAQSHLESALMREFGLGNHLHFLESPPDKWEEQLRFRWFLDAGLLTDKVIFGHFIHVTPFILEETVKAGAGMSWNPLSNGRLASGTPDIVAYRKAGLRIGLGVDGQASADIADPFENMRAGLYAVRAREEDATALAPYDVVRMHTLGAAEVLGAADRIGSLEKGKLADFLVIDPADFGPVFDPWASLVFVGSTRQVESVRVGGELLVRDGRPVKHDWPALRAEIASRVAAGDAPAPAAADHAH